MSGTRKRNARSETSQIEDGLAALASMLADMLAGVDQDRSPDTPERPLTRSSEESSTTSADPGQS